MQKAIKGAAVAAMFLCSSNAFAADAAAKCEAAKLKTSSSYAACRLKAEATAIAKGLPPDSSKCGAKFDDKFAAAETKAEGSCPTAGDIGDVRSFIEGCTDAIAAGLHTGSLLDDPATCNGNLTTCQGDLAQCNIDLASVGSLCGLRGIGGDWTLNLPDAVPSPDVCTLTLEPGSATTLSSVISGCSYLTGANATGTLGSNSATAIQDGAPICGGYRLEATLTFSTCEAASGSYSCLTGPGGLAIFSGTLTATR